jgi:hypothetical protein
MVVVFVFCGLLVSGYSKFMPAPDIATNNPTRIVEVSPTVASEKTATPDKTPTNVTETITGFTGKWISYNVISLDTSSASKNKPGMRLKIAVDQYEVDDSSCSSPEYKASKITQKEFFQGKNPPKSSIELNETEFPLLSTGCLNVKPASIALINTRTIAAILGSDLIYFEPDFSVTENDMEIRSEMVAESNADPLYEMHAQAPVLVTPDNADLNILLKKAITTELDGFRGNFKDWQIPPEMAGYTSFMWIGYDVPLLTPELVSIRFTVDYYMAGAAHPNHYFKVVNYDLAAGKEIFFKDLFKDPVKALDFLSKASKTSLNKPDFPLFEEGFQPKVENFTNWNLTKDSLRISFDPIQVAPYAAGAQEVLIPFKDLRDLVDTKTGFGAFIAR